MTNYCCNNQWAWWQAISNSDTFLGYELFSITLLFHYRAHNMFRVKRCKSLINRSLENANFAYRYFEIGIREAWYHKFSLSTLFGQHWQSSWILSPWMLLKKFDLFVVCVILKYSLRGKFCLFVIIRCVRELDYLLHGLPPQLYHNLL